MLGTLSERETGVDSMRFGLTDGQPKTLDEIGKLYGVTRERIRQIESKTMSRLRVQAMTSEARNTAAPGGPISPDGPCLRIASPPGIGSPARAAPGTAGAGAVLAGRLYPRKDDVLRRSGGDGGVVSANYDAIIAPAGAGRPRDRGGSPRGRAGPGRPGRPG